MADVSSNPVLLHLREREMIYDLWEAATGYRMVNNNYFRIGGVAVDLLRQTSVDFVTTSHPKLMSTSA